MRASIPWGLMLQIGEDGLDPDLKVRGPNGTVLCAVGFNVTLYIEHGDTPEVREGLLRAYERCVTWTGRPFSWGADPEDGEPGAVLGSRLGDVRSWSSDVLQLFDLQMLFTGARDIDDADDYTFLAVSRELEEGELSYLSITLPLATLAQHSADQLTAMVQDLCGLVGPVHGYAGPAIVMHPAGADDDATEAAFRLARRYAGLDVEMTAHHAPYLSSERRIKGVHFITILGHELVAELGGNDALEKALGQVTAFRSSLTKQHGVILRAAQRPIAGDTRRGESLAPYARIARVLKPIRSTNPALIWPQRSPGFSFGEARAWMQRFDLP